MLIPKRCLKYYYNITCIILLYYFRQCWPSTFQKTRQWLEYTLTHLESSWPSWSCEPVPYRPGWWATSWRSLQSAASSCPSWGRSLVALPPLFAQSAALKSAHEDGMHVWNQTLVLLAHLVRHFCPVRTDGSLDAYESSSSFLAPFAYLRLGKCKKKAIFYPINHINSKNLPSFIWSQVSLNLKQLSLFFILLWSPPPLFLPLFLLKSSLFWSCWLCAGCDWATKR